MSVAGKKKKAKRKQLSLPEQKAAEAAGSQKFAVITLIWDREGSALCLEHPFVPFPEAAGIIQMAESVVRDCIENGGSPV